MAMRFLSLILILSLCAPALADQKVYETVGPNGETTFSDTPSPGAKEMVVPPAPTYQAPPIPMTPSPSGNPSSQVSTGQSDAYHLVKIVAPADHATVVNTAGTVAVTVLVEPPLKVGRGDRIQLTLDGNPATEAASPNISLKGVDRGTHTLEAQVVDRVGATLMESAPVTFYLHRPSIHLPGRKKTAPPPSNSHP